MCGLCVAMCLQTYCNTDNPATDALHFFLNLLKGDVADSLDSLTWRYYCTAIWLYCSDNGIHASIDRLARVNVQ